MAFQALFQDLQVNRRREGILIDIASLTLRSIAGYNRFGRYCATMTDSSE